MMSIGEAPRYSGKCRDLSPEKVKENLANGKPYIVRFKTPSQKISFNDLIRGKVEFDTNLFGDFSIAKSENAPLYNLAVVIDDYEMKISHVIRGEDHISNTPKQILVQKALDFPSLQYAHLPLILGSDKSKLSKRHGAVSVTDYRKEGYLPEAFINVMALLGWNPGTEREIYSLPSLVKDFSLEKCQKGGAVFSLKRLEWINGFYIRKSSIDRITELAIPFLVNANLIQEIKNSYGNLNIPNGSKGPKELKLFKEKERKFKIVDTKEAVSINWLRRVVAIHQERLKKVSEIAEVADFFFKEEIDCSKDLLTWKKASEEQTKQSLQNLDSILSEVEVSNFSEEKLKNVLMSEAEKLGDRGMLLWPLRVALSGKKASAGPFEIAEILGKNRVLKRIKKAKQLFS
jgi:glutamyl/glutaminyl-tRNA synthetase